MPVSHSYALPIGAASKPPRPAKPEIRPLTQDQARALLASAKDDRFYALYVLALHCGLREDELLGLMWEDADIIG